jgi:PAS domain S-box-containing protein
MQSPLRILHLEDDAKDAELLQAMLEAEGIVSHVTRVDSQADFLASLEQSGFDLIFADYSLPSFDGLSALRIALEKSPDVPFIFVSGTLGEEVAIETLKIGATDYVLKDRLSRIVPSVQRALREAQERAERKRVEQALREAEERYRVLIEVSPQTVWMGRADGYITYCNQWWFNYTGLTMEQTHGEGWAQAVHPDHRERFNASWLQTVATGGEWNVEIPFRRAADGQYRWHLCKGLPIRDGEGRIVQWMGIAIDIHDRHEAERALRESEAKLEEAQRLTHVGYWDRDLDTDFITWSDETYRIYGLPPEERIVTISRLLELIHAEDRQMMLEAVAAALRGGPRYDVEYRVVRPNGEVRIVHSQGDVTWDETGRPRRMFGTTQDITERKRVEQRLVVQHTVTQILAEAATLEEATPKILQAVCECLAWDVGALWRTDREAGVLRCVEVWHKESIEVPEFEVTSRETTFAPGIGLPGRVWFTREPAYIPDAVRDPHVQRAPIAAREGLHAAFGFPILLGGEVLGVMEFFSREIRQPDQDLLTMMAIIGSQIGQFIERKRAEDALHHAQAELAHVTRVMTMGELASSIAHEINQPLAGATANGNAGLRWLARDPPDLDEARACLQRIIRDGRRAGEVIARMRTFVRKAEPQKVRLAIHDVIAEVIALANGELRRHGVLLTTDLAAHLPPVLADRIQLQQVLLNLLLNGMEAMRGVTERPRALIVRAQPEEDAAIRVAVEDAGVGIAPQDLERLFTPFFTTKPEGMGLGLAISRSIVEAHGGKLWATPNLGPGVTVHFTLPTADGSQPE